MMADFWREERVRKEEKEEKRKSENIQAEG